MIGAGKVCTRSTFTSSPNEARGSTTGAASAAAAKVKRRRLTARDIATSKESRAAVDVICGDVSEMTVR
jgi:cobalamin biosynthesis protein CbiD